MDNKLENQAPQQPSSPQQNAVPPPPPPSSPVDLNIPPHYDPSRMYPALSVSRNTNPNRLWAIPLLGGLVKLIVLIPQTLMIIFALLLIFILGIVNSFSVLFTGRIMGVYFNWVARYLTLHAKVTFFYYGITEKYPGFNFRSIDGISLSFPHPQSSKRLFAIPLLGFLIRYTILIPFMVFFTYIYNGAGYMVLASSSIVLFKKYYPQSTHELAVDSTRTFYSWMLYLSGISDIYPSFRISENKLGLKIFFVALPIFVFVINIASSISSLIANIGSNMANPDSNYNTPFQNDPGFEFDYDYENYNYEDYGNTNSFPTEDPGDIPQDDSL